MAWSQTDLDTINAAIANGAKRVRFQTHEVEYQSVTELLRARDKIKAEVESQSATAGAILTSFESGY